MCAAHSTVHAARNVKITFSFFGAWGEKAFSFHRMLNIIFGFVFHRNLWNELHYSGNDGQQSPAYNVKYPIFLPNVRLVWGPRPLSGNCSGYVRGAGGTQRNEINEIFHPTQAKVFCFIFRLDSRCRHMQNT